MRGEENGVKGERTIYVYVCYMTNKINRQTCLVLLFCCTENGFILTIENTTIMSEMGNERKCFGVGYIRPKDRGSVTQEAEERGNEVKFRQFGVVLQRRFAYRFIIKTGKYYCRFCNVNNELYM